MELLDDTTNQISKNRRLGWNKWWIKRKYDNRDIRFKTSMIRSNLCDYSDGYILVKGTITVPNMEAAGVAVNNTNKKVILKNCPPFTGCITQIKNIEVDDAQKIDIVMPMYNLIEHSDP